MLRGLIDRLTAWLNGWPDELLTISLLVVAVMLVYIAMRASPAYKAVTLAWTVLP